MSHIIAVIQGMDPDIVTLQETHSKGGVIQAQIISEQTGLRYFINDEYDNSHIEEGQRLGQAIISRFPLSNRRFELFYNPHFSVTQPNGDVWISHDKGTTSCIVSFTMGVSLLVRTLHLIPFKRFKVDMASAEAKAVLADVVEKTKRGHILQGDFNFDIPNLRDIVPEMFVGISRHEFAQTAPTTPTGRRYDHVVYKGISGVKSCVIDSVLTDHYPLWSSFEW